MATIQEHIDKAQHNEQIARSLIMPNGPTYLDWAVIALFYSALHYIDAYLIPLRAEPRFHDERHRWLNSVDRQLSVQYRSLYDEGLNARYFLYSIDSARLYSDIIPNFETVRDTVRRSLSTSTSP